MKIIMEIQRVNNLNTYNMKQILIIKEYNN